MPKLLFLGDIVGKPGRDAVIKRLPQLRQDWALDFVVANGENSAAGAGISGAIARDLFAAGVDAITLGDHVWDQRGFEDEIKSLDKLCRPANLPVNCPGRTYVIIEKAGYKLAVFTVLGRQFMNNTKADCPFLCSDKLLRELKGQANAFLVEIHAEATSEKIAIGWYLDGRAGLVVGTHTHVPTADAAILPRGTAYLTDAGMCGPYASVLGREVRPVLGRFLDGMPRKFDVATEDVRLSGALVELTPDGAASHIELITVRLSP
ncbi:MAG: TIGR00282 family metallophosphoesterase [Verrucomicrobiota bacterium]|nr:TIGR00282 family metallophosphoesterase [Verrucomicrobiota bacterium]